MKDSKAARRTEAALWNIMLERGPGTIHRTEKTIGLVPDALRNTRRHSGLRHWHITDAVESLGVPLSVFFNDIFGGVSTTATERFMARGAELAARKLVDLPVMAEETKPDRLTEKDLERLDAARFEDPRAAAEQAAGVARLAARDGRRGDAVAAVARQGSALRVAEEWEQAWVCVWWALKSAPDGPIETDLRLRSAALLSDFGEHRDAADFAWAAATEYLLLDVDGGIGKALMNCGAYLFYLEDYTEARLYLSAALRYLADDAMDLRFSVHQVLGLVFVELGEFDRASSHLATAESFEQASAKFKPQLTWFRARIAAGREDSSNAIRLYEATLLELEASPGDMALAGVELCRVLLKAGFAAEAVKRAHALAALAIPRQQNRIVSEAILKLYHSARKGRLALQLIERTIARIRWGLNRRAAVDARPDDSR